ncbi:MAG: hypothetical protein LAO30_00460 [Acidobacteriia bacterium]|nr:hypothetical protein [Terriglobia bacterium]
MRAHLKSRVLAALLTSAFCLPWANAQVSASGSAGLASGTLNLILANKNGFVIAADSRMSSDTPFECEKGLPKRLYCDNSQKLFKTGNRSAMVIAGFAAGRAEPPSPFDLVVASVLRKSFGPCGQRIFQVTTGPEPKGEVVCAPDAMALPVWAQIDLVPALTAVASLYDPEHLPSDKMFFVTSFASIDKQGKISIQQQYFNGHWVYASGNVPVPVYSVSRTPGDVVDRFYPVAEGINDIALQVLRGQYESPDPTIRSYYRRLLAGPSGRDSMTVSEMRELARVILRETRKAHRNFVGGPDQIGVFPVKGQPSISGLAGLSKDKQLTPRFFLNSCLVYDKDHRGSNGPCMNGTLHEDFMRPLDEVIAQFFLASRFKDVSVAIDNNYFVRSEFDGVTFKYTGKKPPFALGNTYNDCSVELPEGVDFNSPEISAHCRLIRMKNVSLDQSTLGRPVQYQKVGGSIRLTLPNR